MFRFYGRRFIQAGTSHSQTRGRLVAGLASVRDTAWEPLGGTSRHWSRGQHSGSIFMHHTTVGGGVNVAAVTLGLIHSLSLLRPGVGYFRPIDSTSHGGQKSKLVKEVYKLPGSIQDMHGCTQDEALALIAQDRTDDLIDTIMRAYEEYKARHDFVVVEGTNLKDGTNTTPLNGAIAAALSTPALLITDAMSASQRRMSTQMRTLDWNAIDWESDVMASIIEHERILKREHVDVVGALVYKAPSVSRGKSVLRQKLEEHNMAFAGAIPEDATLSSIQVLDIQSALNAEVFYGRQAEAAFSTEVTNVVVGTLQLDDFVEYLPTHTDPSKGAMVVSHLERVDILLGMLALHESHLQSNLAAILLTGGKAPSGALDRLMRNRIMETTLPVLVVGTPTYETCIALSQVQPRISPTSTRKIERSQVLFDDNVDMEALQKMLFQERTMRMNPKLFQHTLFQRAKAAQMHIVLPEIIPAASWRLARPSCFGCLSWSHTPASQPIGVSLALQGDPPRSGKEKKKKKLHSPHMGEEPRTIQAAGEVLRRGLAQLTMLGKRETVVAMAKQFRVDLDSISIVDPSTSPDLERYTEQLYEARKKKGLTMERAREQLIQDVNFFGTAMVAAGDADGMVSGAIHTTANTVRPALQVIKTLPGTPIVSSVFFMCLPDKVLVYGDCAINTDPTAEELAMIAIASADTAAAFGIEPRVAMLSYATGDSNQGPLIQKVIDATRRARELRPELAIEGPLQYDAAVNPETARTKMKGKATAVAGKATVLIFPDLNTGNNTYKAVQQSTGAIAMGPLLQGLRKPVNDLSRGCTVTDIVTTVALTAVQAKGMQNSPMEDAAA